MSNRAIIKLIEYVSSLPVRGDEGLLLELHDIKSKLQAVNKRVYTKEYTKVSENIIDELYAKYTANGDILKRYVCMLAEENKSGNMSKTREVNTINKILEFKAKEEISDAVLDYALNVVLERNKTNLNYMFEVARGEKKRNPVASKQSIWDDVLRQRGEL